MPYDFQPDPQRKGRNSYVGSWREPACRPIPLSFTRDSLRQVLDWGAQADAPYNHQEIAHWCDRMHMQFLDTDQSPELESAVRIAAEVDCQWDLFLANTYTLEQLRELDFAAVRLPSEWFVDWQTQLSNAEPSTPADDPEPRRSL
jgi:hypothetical protein